VDLKPVIRFCFGASVSPKRRILRMAYYDSDYGGKPKKWIQGAIKHPGALHKELGVPEGKKIPAKKLAAAAQKGGKEGERARLAQTLSKMHKK
jgi:hypothetical protein